MRHASVLQFPVAPARRLPWDDDSIHTGVHELIALAPVLGRRNPEAVPAVERMMRTLIGSGPSGGRERTPRAARPPTQVRPRPAKVTMDDVFERIHLSDPARQAEMRPLIRAYLKARHA